MGEKSKSGMGHGKHRKSGKAGKSPKLRHALKRETGAQDKHPRKVKTKMYDSIKELLDDQKA